MHYFDPKYWRNFSVESEKLKFFLESLRNLTHMLKLQIMSLLFTVYGIMLGQPLLSESPVKLARENPA